MSQAETTRREVPWAALELWTLIVGLAGLALWGLGWGLGVSTGSEAMVRKAFFSYLFAYGFVLSLPLGSMAIWMVHNQTGGVWGLPIRRLLEANTRLIPLMAILFLPIAFGVPHLYLWNNTTLVHELHSEELARAIDYKQGYLNPMWFYIRAAIYFVIWTLVAWNLQRMQDRLDAHPEDRLTARRLQIFSGPGLVLFGLAMTFAAIDWLMSLEPTWYSTIFPVLIVMGMALPALAFAIAAAVWLFERRPFSDLAIVERDIWNDLGNLLLAVVMLWAYMSFSQLLLIWSGNLPEEITWYLKRSQYGWEWYAGVLALLNFGIPFCLLLARDMKRQPRKLQGIACLLIAAGILNWFWLVNPVYYAIQGGLHRGEGEHYGMDRGGPIGVSWLDLVALVGLAGITLRLLLWQLRRRPIAPPPLPLADVEEETAHV